MIFKLMACSCFILGSIGFGWTKVKEYHRRYEELIYIKYILNSLLLETESHKGTFGESCFALSMGLKEPYKSIFEGLYQLLERERRQEPRIYWNEKIRELSGVLMLRKEEERILQGVIRCTDGTTMAMPLEVLRQSLAEWDNVIHEAEVVRKDRSKVTLCLSVTAGLVLCITII